jgi:uncharacterized protein (DUF1501 family)
MNDRRDFLRTSSLLGFGATVPTFLGTTALAAPPADKAGAKDTVLVVVQLTGGNDGLNTVIPYKNDLYYKYRPTIAVPKDRIVGVDKNVGLHPSAGPLARLLNDKQAACIVQGVGYPNPDQSHFRSMDIWHAASTAANLTDGWIGKALKAKHLSAFHLAAENEIAPLALAGAPARVPSLTKLEDFQLKLGAASGQQKIDQKNVIESVAKGEPMPPKKPDLLDFVRRTAMNTYESTNRIKAIGTNYEPKVPYPANGFANRLKLAAQLIDAGIGARLFYVSLDGFDTHSGQGGVTGTHANLLDVVTSGISAFWRDLAERGHGNRVCVMTFSEFGRRAKENGSNGTDHGSGAPMILVGGKVKAGVVGDHPSLEKIPDGNLVHAIDFRRVYASVLDQWLGIDPKPIVGAEYKPMELFTA